jgi:ribonuclease T2
MAHTALCWGAALGLVLAAGSCPAQTSQSGPAPQRLPTPIAGPTPPVHMPAELAAPEPAGAGFDHYVLALSWSPSYCAAEGSDANRQQCAGGRPYAFVVHGLWPQFRYGEPAVCPGADQEVSRERLRGLYDLIPSAGLIRHEWRMHGSCAGLSQTAYFALLRRAWEKIRIPAEFGRLSSYRMVDPQAAEQSFITANPGLSSDGIAVTCDRRYLREVRICLTRELDFAACPELGRRACRLTKAVMPPVRGG